MPEVERPKFRKDAKQTERSLKGKVVGDLLHFAKLAKRSFKGKGGWRFSWDSAVLERLVRSELWQGLRMLRSFEDDTPINFNPHRS